MEITHYIKTQMQKGDTILSKEVGNLAKPIQEMINPLRGKETIKEIISTMKKHGGVIFWAHPIDSYSRLRWAFNDFIVSRNFTDQQKFLQWLSENHPEIIWVLNNVTGLEALNGCPNQWGWENWFMTKLCKTLNKPASAGSDSHIDDMVGRVYMEVEHINSKEEFLKVVKNPKNTVHISEFGKTISSITMGQKRMGSPF